MTPRVYVIPASPPCAAIEAALRLKRIDYDVTELPPVLHAVHQLARFGAPTVPSMTVDGDKISGSRAIARRLDELAPEPPLLGPDPARHDAILEIERWQDEEFQPLVRRVIWRSLMLAPRSVPSFLEGSRLPLPAPVARLAGPATAPLGALRNRASDQATRADLRALPGALRRVQGWLDEGLLGGDPPTIADLQIGAVVALFLTIEDVATVIRRHPDVEALARRHFPGFPGRVPRGALPADAIPTG